MLSNGKLAEILSGLKKNSFDHMVLGNPVTVQEITLLPVLSVSTAFGGFITQQGTGGGGIRLDPVAVVAVKKDTVDVFSLRTNQSTSPLENIAAIISEALSNETPGQVNN
ncbi:spore germination protein GerW family protein [Desulfallas thermosapovorans]|uniref:Putative spore protein YtfJ n=1 Tax=Desulfallas thermosapovorans DSM 6562 TaxID=1121431 RepID=A0A5S4ZQN6_9FIRM|nr:spore germination protein GerW family protein [Desulfallas thermosapovorans]TYO94920.1 putative spore protein YtfJ [Desulfallas thermosapovorans DSM 6562]